MILLALVDDHAITRKGIKSILEMSPEIKVIAEASNGKEILELLGQLPELPDILLLDISMPVMNGFDTLKQLQKRYPSIKVIIFSMLSQEDTVIHMIQNGASGFINKNTDPSMLAKIVVKVNQTGYYLGDIVKKKYFKKMGNPRKEGMFIGKKVLSPKEIAFIRLSTSNLNYKEIAEILEVSPKTIENYRDSLFQKLEIKNRAALALYAFQNGIIDPFTRSI